MGRPSDYTPETADIYGLFDAEGRLRYIGKAVDPERRLKGHMRECSRRNTPLYAWLRKHGVPVLRVLEAGCDDWREAERRLIREARERGDRLLNVADGGDQPHCSREVRAANGARNAAKLHADPIRRRIWAGKRALGQALKQGFVTNATRAKMRAAAISRPALFGEWLNLPDRVEANG